MNLMNDVLAPGGLLIATNVDAVNPIQHIMSFIFEWHLLYRTRPQFSLVAPDGVPADDCRITADSTSCNIFIEIRKPVLVGA
jgi:extracellular factor (EF) 3-hydroxypalmitic acid methyl ester biosynthesis protein